MVIRGPERKLLTLPTLPNFVARREGLLVMWESLHKLCQWADFKLCILSLAGKLTLQMEAPIILLVTVFSPGKIDSDNKVELFSGTLAFTTHKSRWSII